LDRELQGQPEREQEKKALEKAIREFEGFKKYIHEFKVEPGPSSTAGLILSIFFSQSFGCSTLLQCRYIGSRGCQSLRSSCATRHVLACGNLK
jgi:hypothetical protein